MHTTPWFHATNLPNVSPKNLVQVGIGGWQVPREAVAVARERETTILTMSDVEQLGVDKVAEIALSTAWDGTDAVYMSFDIDCVDCGFVPGTGWPEPGGFLPREILSLVGKVAAEGLCGLEIVEVSPPYDTSDITALFAVRVVVDVLGPWFRRASWAPTRPSSTNRSASRSHVMPHGDHRHGPGHNHALRQVAAWELPRDQPARPRRAGASQISIWSSGASSRPPTATPTRRA